MWVSTRGQYGLRAAIEIARVSPNLIAIKDIAARQDISVAYLEQILSDLRRAGILRSERGAFGGYKLARDATQITALDVITALEGSIAPVQCVEDSSQCSHVNNCGTENLWRQVDSLVRGILESETIALLLEEALRQEHSQFMQLEVLV